MPPTSMIDWTRSPNRASLPVWQNDQSKKSRPRLHNSSPVSRQSAVSLRILHVCRWACSCKTYWLPASSHRPRATPRNRQFDTGRWNRRQLVAGCWERAGSGARCWGRAVSQGGVAKSSRRNITPSHLLSLVIRASWTVSNGCNVQRADSSKGKRSRVNLARCHPSCRKSLPRQDRSRRPDNKSAIAVPGLCPAGEPTRKDHESQAA
jgi:hypothetical protein